MKKCFILAFLLSTIAFAGAWAQNLPGGVWSSPQNTATEGRYRSNADDYIRPDSYTGIKFNKWYGMVSFINNYYDGANDAIATAGFATKVKGVYIGAFYGGNFWAGSPPNNYAERQFPDATPPTGGAGRKTYNVYNNISVVPEPVNNAALLIGFADMGVRLTYRTNFQSFKDSNLVTSGLRVPDYLGGTDTQPVPAQQLYKSYHAQGGYIAPQIAWAMAKDLTKNGIRPYATLDLVFERNNQKVETAGADAAGNSGERIVYSENHFDPSLGLGMGGYTFFSKDGFKLSADVDYILSLNIYNNEYSYVENGKYKTDKIKGRFRVGQFPFEEKSYVFNSLTPSLSGSWSADRLALKFKLNLPLTLTNEKSSLMNLDDSNTLINYGVSESFVAFGLRPDLRLAMQYKIIPDRLLLNVGARIQASALTLKTINREEYDSDGYLTDSFKVHDNLFGAKGSFASRFHLGAVFNFTENVWVDAMTGVSNAYGDNAIDVFAPGGLFSFGSILVVLKF
jgi:hypothetical protein